MKKIYLLAIASILGLNVMAQQKSNVVVFSEDGETFFAFLNGVKQNPTAQSNVKIVDIPGEGASLRVVFANSSDQPLKQDLYFMEPNQEHTIKIKRDKKGVLKMRYFGAVPLAQSTTTAPVVTYTPTEIPSGTVNTTTSNTGTVNNTVTTTGTSGTETVQVNTQVSDPGMSGSSQTVTTTTTTTNSSTTNGGSENVNMSIGIGNNGVNMNVNVSGTVSGQTGSENVNMNTGVNMSGMETTETVTTTTTTTNHSSTSYSSTGSTTGTTDYSTTGTTYSHTGCAFAMDDAAFQKMKKAVEGNAFDDTKMSTAKTATKGSCLSTDQIKEIMLLFNMDDDRLEYAKYAYDYTVDKNNFYLLGEAFVFDGNKTELNAFIETKR